MAMAPKGDNHEDIDAFTKEWIIFYRRFYGCLSEGELICKPEFAKFDIKQYNKARELAKKVFGFEK